MNRPSTSSERTLPVTPRGQKTRQKLLRAAEAIFGEKGYERASIADITRKSGVALGTFYVYFPDKQSIFVEVVDELGERLRRLIAESVTGHSDRIDVEREGLRAFFEFARAHPNLYRVVRQAEFVDEACYRRYYDRFAKGYVRGLTQAMEDGQIRAMDPETLAYCLMGIGDFLGMRWIIWEEDPGLERVLDTAMALIRHGLDPRPMPRPAKAPGKTSSKTTTPTARRGARPPRTTRRSMK
jgi:AcrR family transcriptional regulator